MHQTTQGTIQNPLFMTSFHFWNNKIIVGSPIDTEEFLQGINPDIERHLAGVILETTQPRFLYNCFLFFNFGTI